MPSAGPRPGERSPQVDTECFWHTAPGQGQSLFSRRPGARKPSPSSASTAIPRPKVEGAGTREPGPGVEVGVTGAAVGVRLGVAVAATAVGVRLAVAVAACVALGVAAAAVGVRLGVAVAACVALGVAVALGGSVGVLVGLSVGCEVDVAVAVVVAVAVGVAVGAACASKAPASQLPLPAPGLRLAATGRRSPSCRSPGFRTRSGPGQGCSGPAPASGSSPRCPTASPAADRRTGRRSRNCDPCRWRRPRSSRCP